MSNQGTPHHSHKLRHYVIMTTLVVLGLFVLLLFNNNSDGFGFTSAVVENVRNNSIIGSLGHSDSKIPEDAELLKVEPISKGPNDIEFELSSAVIPQVQKDTKIDGLEIIFNDLTASIKVNDDKLELNDLKQVALGIKGFTGYLAFDETQFTLDGIIKSLAVNGITLSASKDIKLSFNNLNYQQAKLSGAEFKTIEFVSGPGKVLVPGRLDYGLEDGQLVTIYNYYGSLALKKENKEDINQTTSTESSTLIGGYAKGLDVVSGALNINLR